MCPDRDLISAYVDGEVPSPWSERLEEHLADCGDCAAVAAGYRALGARLKADLAVDEAASLSRLRSRVELLLEDMPATGSRASRSPRPQRPWSALRRPVSLPLPIAAAAALLVLLLAGATTLLALKPTRVASLPAASIQTVASGEISPVALEAKSQPGSMDELLRYLEARDGQVTLTINLPSGTTFGSSGKPVIMRTNQGQRDPQNGLPVGGSSP